MVCQRLSRLDEHYLARLVERAFEGGNPSESRRRGIDDSDLPVLERLTRLFPCAEEACAGGTARIACVLERFVQSALRDRDPDPIALLYTQLFDSELSISPAVAHRKPRGVHDADPSLGSLDHHHVGQALQRLRPSLGERERSFPAVLAPRLVLPPSPALALDGRTVVPPVAAVAGRDFSTC